MQNTTCRLRLAEATDLACRAIVATGVEMAEARATALALVEAERDELGSHGLARLPFYLEQLGTGKINPRARPTAEVKGAVVRVDAQHGLAFPAVAYGLDVAIPLCRELGIVALAIAHSHHFGVAGHPVERAAGEGLLAFAFSNAPAAMAPWGGRTPLFGTNPIAFAAPRQGSAPMVIDLSLSKVARGKVMLAKQAGRPIPEGWAIDPEGRPTTDPQAALAGSMIPAGDAKGAGLALMVELITAGLTGCHFGYEASSFFDAEGAPPNVAHLLILLDPDCFGGTFVQRAEALFRAMLDQPGVRLPGDRRLATREAHAETIEIPLRLKEELERYAGPLDQAAR